MPFRPTTKCITLLLVCLLCTATAGIAVADSEYDFRAENAIDTPEYSPTGLTANADHIGVFEQDETIEATITGPDNSYQVGLFDSDNKEIVNKETDKSITFDSDTYSLEPGSYVLRITDPIVDEVVPIVISGYDLSVDLATSADNNELTISTTTTETALSGPPEGVEAVMWNDADQNRVELTKQSESSSTTEYETTVSYSELEGGSYEVYVVATGENEMYSGNNELLGVSEPVSVDVPVDDGSDDSGSNDGSNDDGSDDGSNTGDETNMDDGESTDDETSQDETTEENRTVVENETSTSENETDSNDNSNGGDQTDDGSSVIQPNNTDDNDSIDVDNTSNGQTDDETPHSPVITIISLVLATLVAVYRQ
jgi:hypothetical protein